MNNFTRKSRDRRTVSPLYQKMLMLLLLMVVGVSGAWAGYTTKVELSFLNSSYETSGSKQAASGDGLTNAKISWSNIANETMEVDGNKYYKFNGDDAYIQIWPYYYGISAVFMPGDVVKVRMASTVDQTDAGFCIKTSRHDAGGWQKISANTDYEKTYTLKAEDINDDGSITIYRLGYATNLKYYSFEVTSERHTVTFEGLYGGGNVTAMANGKSLASGDQVGDNTEVTFTATPNGDNFCWKWNIGSTANYDHLNTYTVKVTGDIEVTHQFGKVTVNVSSNDDNLGTVSASCGDKTGKSLLLPPYPGDVTFTATEVGGTFDGWYSNPERTNLVSSDNPFTKNNPAENYLLYAKFNPPTSVTHPALDCESNTIDLTKTTSTCTFNGSTGAGNMTAANQYISIKFASVVDLHELSSLVVTGTNLDKNAETKGVIDNIRFYYSGGDFAKYNSPTNITSFTDEQRENLKTVSEIRIFNGAVTGEFAISSITFNYGGSHNKVTAPTFKDGTASNMTITVGDDLVLSVNESNAFWRQYKSGTDWTQGNQDYTHILSNDYGKPVKTISGLGVGTYYFAAEIPFNCTYGHYHGSELVKVTVTVKAAESEPNVYMYNLDNFPNAGGNVTSVVKNEQEGKVTSVEMTTIGSNNNYLKLINGPIDSKYTGVRVDTKGAAYRVIVKTSDSKTFVANVPSNENYQTSHFKWSDFVQQYQSNKMTEADVAKITEIGLGGRNVEHTEETIYIRHLWLDDIYENNYDRAFVFFGEEGTSFSNIHDGVCDYKYTVNIKEGQANAVFKDITADDHTDRSGKNCVILRKGRELNVTPPTGYMISSMRVSFSEKCNYNLNINWNDGGAKTGNGYYADYNRAYNTLDWVKITIGDDAPEDMALKISKIEFSLEAKKIEETKTLANSNPSNGRQYRIYAPAKIQSKKIPVLFSLHGGDGDWQYENSNGKGVMNFNEVANNDATGFIVVYPRGGFHKLPFFKDVEPSVQEQTPENRNWLSTGEDNDDIEYLKDIIADLKKDTRFTIDEDRIYITGYSNGGMMAYAAANAAADVFAAFSSISGFPMNDFHLQHHGVRPVPFLHIHGTKDSYVNIVHMPTIIDNMVLRNGLNYEPTHVVTQGNASFYGNQTKYDKYVYGTENSGAPYVYYTIGTGSTAGDTGMGHNLSCEINGVPNTQVIWDFMKQFTKPTISSNTIEIKPSTPFTSGSHSIMQSDATARENNNTAREHGWTVNEGQVIASYGESGGYSNLNQGVYHSLQLEGGKKHYIKFTAKNEDSDKTVTVRLIKLGELNSFNTPASSFSVTNDIVLEKYYSPSSTGANIVVEFDAEDMTGGEYNLAFLRSTNNDKTEISNVVVTTEPSTPTAEVSKPFETDFTGWFNYENRLVAQWDFDLCDGPRFLASGLGSNWEKDYDNTDTGGPDAKFGSVTYIYKPALDDFEELYYDDAKQYRVPVTAGLLFKAPASSVKIKVELANGIMKSTQLIVEKGVQLMLSYAVNSFRADNGETNVNDFETTGKRYMFENCMHHINRDIVYAAVSDGNIWPNIEYVWNDPDRKFNGGGDEYINGKTFNKLDHWGPNDKPAVITFTKETKIDRLAVNRNCTYSIYTQYLNKIGYEVPEPGLRIIGTAKGLRVASNGDSGGDYGKCIAVTYGGWENKDYKDFTNGQIVDEKWESITTYDGVDKTDYTKVPIPSDGFYAMSLNPNHATNEALMPQNTPDNLYHPANDGMFTPAPWGANTTPWTLPCRGAYVKFEPTIPGVINIHVFQTAGATYYIADEFGRLVNGNTQNVCMYTKTGTGQTLSSSNGGYVLPTHSDYVKYSFNVYPGKSYYLFSNAAGLGFMGTLFEPYVCRVQIPGQPLSELGRNDILMPSVTFTDDSDYSVDENTFVYTDYTGNQTLTVGDNPDGAHGVKTTKIFSPKTSGVTLAERPTTLGDDYDHDKWQEYQIHFSRQAVKATLSRSAISSTKTAANPDGYAFKKDTWSSICLPFSMNHLALEQTFGPGARVVLLRDIQKEHGLITANFIGHENQDIIAGYPYFIYPTQNVKDIVANVSLYDDDDDSQGTNHLPAFGSIVSADQYDGIGGYEFKGILSRVDNPAVGSYVMATNGSLTRIAQANNAIKPYRAYLEYVGESGEASAKAIGAMSFSNFLDMDDDSEVTKIEDVNMDNLLWNAGFAPKATNVYSVTGQLVRENTVDLRGLPKGTYIVNGKKYFVK